MIDQTRENSRYLESKSLVLLMMNFVTSPPSSFNFFSLSALTVSFADASRPRIIEFSKFFRKSFFVPKKFGFAKLSKEKYSERSFWRCSQSIILQMVSNRRTWIGVPVKMTLLLTFRPFRAWKVSDS